MAREAGVLHGLHAQQLLLVLSRELAGRPSWGLVSWLHLLAWLC
jgi:hypothetical protein